MPTVLKVFLFGILFSSIFTAQVSAQTNTFQCNFNLGTGECYEANPDCYPWTHDVDDAYCDAYSDSVTFDGTACYQQVNIPCVEVETSLFKCVSFGTCTPCNIGDEGCVYQDAEACLNACTGNAGGYRCTITGCVQDSSCDTSDPDCFDNAIACETSGCIAATPTPLPSCGDYDTEEECNPVNNCTWRNGDCVVGTDPVPTPTPYQSQDTDFEIAEFALCARAGDQLEACRDCYNRNGVWTAVGCLSFVPADFSKDFLTLGVALAGGIALLLMMYGSFLLSTSQGNPDQAQHAKEVIMGAVIGLFMIVFSMVLLRVIGIEVLKLPGF